MNVFGIKKNKDETICKDLKDLEIKPDETLTLRTTKKKKEPIYGYKGFYSNLTCKDDFQYEIKKTYTLDESKMQLELCSHGFHYCEKLKDVFDYYCNDNDRFCKVEIIGKAISDGNKSITNKIKIIEEIKFNDLSEEEKIKIVKADYRSLNYIDSPSFDLQKIAIQQKASSIRYIKNPSLEIQKLAIEIECEQIKNIKNASIEIQKFAITKNIYSIKYIDNPSIEIQKFAVQRDEFAIEYIYHPSLEVQKLAVQQNGFAIQYIKNPYKVIQKLAVMQNGYSIGCISKPFLDIQKLAVLQTPEAINYIDDPCEELINMYDLEIENVDINSHYFGNITDLENEYPNVKFIYMTGHLDGFTTGDPWFDNNNTASIFSRS